MLICTALPRQTISTAQKIVDEILYPERKVEPKPNTNGAAPEPGKAPYMPMLKIESVYDSDAYPKDVRYEYVALEHITTRFRTEFDYQLKIYAGHSAAGSHSRNHPQAQGIPCFSGICARRGCADSITSDTMYAVNGSPKECAFEAKRKSPQIFPRIPMKPSNVWHGHSTRRSLPAGTARKVNGSLLRGRRNRLISPAKKNRKFPLGELPALLIVCGFLQGASGRAHPVFAFNPLIRDYLLHSSDTRPAHRSRSVRHTPAGHCR